MRCAISSLLSALRKNKLQLRICKDSCQISPSVIIPSVLERLHSGSRIEDKREIERTRHIPLDWRSEKSKMKTYGLLIFALLGHTAITLSYLWASDKSCGRWSLIRITSLAMSTGKYELLLVDACHSSDLQTHQRSAVST